MIFCRWAPSLGALEGTSAKVWGTYDIEHSITPPPSAPCLWFGLYGFPDFIHLWKYKGPKRYILWAGSDIKHFQKGYWLDDTGQIKLDPTALAQWINVNCESWCENDVERMALEDVGIYAQVGQSFMGDVNDFPITFERAERPQVYLSANPGREVEYGWQIVEDIADKCDVDFHLFGSPDWQTKHSNVFVRGRVPKEIMNAEIQKMQCGLRLNEFDGFSEITAKSVLWGQYPIVRKEFNYPFLSGFAGKAELIKQINDLKNKTGPNPARDYYMKNLNNFPWVCKK